MIVKPLQDEIDRLIVEIGQASEVYQNTLDQDMKLHVLRLAFRLADRSQVLENKAIELSNTILLDLFPGGAPDGYEDLNLDDEGPIDLEWLESVSKHK